MRTYSIIAVVYFLGLVLTYGWTYHRDCQSFRSSFAHECGFMAGLGWPAYWVLKGARDGLRPYDEGV